jgi:5-histidylcysteine sulfoxide synthase
MSFEHERIHLETSSVLIREMEVTDLRIPKLFLAINHQQNSQSTIDYPKNEFVKIAAKKVSIGKKDQSTYGWDNEYGSKEIEVESFLVSKFLISNGEFFEFVKNDGYHLNKYWCKKGLAWRKFRNTYHPTFWVPNGPKGSNLFKLRICFEIIEMRWDYPAIVNHYEAQAFCRYKSELENKNYHLPFEAQHNALQDFQSDPIKSTPAKNFNFNLQNLSENSVDANQQGAQGLYDIHGNVWQWLEDNFYPLKGFEIHKYYPDFSTPCFDDKHKMIAGSSFFSTGNLASIYSRYHFRPHFFQHCGFRIIKAEGSYFKKNIEIKFTTENPNDGKKYVIFTEDGELKILEKEGFEMLL